MKPAIHAFGLATLVVLAADGVSAASLAQATVPPPATPQVQAAPAGQRLRVFLDCDCYRDYLREEIDWVDYVRQAQDADVHLLSSSTGTGGGGRELVLRFVGRGRFVGVDQELRVVTLSGDTDDTERRAILRATIVGFLSYIARAGLPSGLNVSVTAREVQAAAPKRDRWNLWVFEVEANGSFDAQESNRSREVDLSVSADRVSAQWKVSVGARTEQKIERFTLDLDEDEPEETGTLKTFRRSSSLDALVVKSLGPHWSFGAGTNVNSSTFGNTRLASKVVAAVEFSVFPYADYATRQLVLSYQAGPERAEYNEVTLFDKLAETLGRQQIGLRLDQTQPWGSLQAQVDFSQYFHDLSKYRLAVSGEVDIRIARGLSLSLEGSASRIRDQLSLPKRDASASEVLLRLRELQSGYRVDFSFGISYTFGSLFNNVVNPRFGR